MDEAMAPNRSNYPDYGEMYIRHSVQKTNNIISKCH